MIYNIVLGILLLCAIIGLLMTITGVWQRYFSIRQWSEILTFQAGLNVGWLLAQIVFFIGGK